MPRCENCKKKNIILIKCTCKNSYCVKCRHKEIHNCLNIDADIEWERVQLNNKLKKDKVGEEKRYTPI